MPEVSTSGYDETWTSIEQSSQVFVSEEYSTNAVAPEPEAAATELRPTVDSSSVDSESSVSSAHW